jgi:CelD/BcsL family acetyltransferase involved in cellulose biosynthesis
VHLVVIEDPDGFAALRTEWDRLLARSPQASPFLLHGWLDAWWSIYRGAADRLHVVCCREDSTDALVGALGAYVRESGPGALPTKTLRYLGDASVGSYRLGCFSEPGRESDVFAAISHHLLTGFDRWDTLDLRRGDSRAGLADLLADEARAAGCRVLRDQVTASSVVELRDDWEAYLATLSHRLRSVARKTRHRVEALDGFGVEVVTGPEELGPALADAAVLSANRGNADATLDVEKYARFLAAVSPRLLEVGWLRLMFLRVQGRRVAFVYQIACGDTMYAYQTAFDKGWAEWRVGMALFGYAIEQAIEQGLRYYDLLPGDDEYKARWAAKPLVEISSTCVFGPTTAGRLAAAAHVTGTTVRRTLKRVVPTSIRGRLRATYYRRRENSGS